MNKQRQALFILLFAIFGWAELSAQPVFEDVIYFTNGSIVRGKVLKNQDDSVKIETYGRNVFVYNNKEINKIVKEEITVSEIKQIKRRLPDNQKGMYSYSTLGLLIGNSKSEDAQTFSFMTSAGYQFNNFAGLGLGLGIEKLQTEIVPFFFSYKTNLSKKENSSFLQFNLGYSVPLSKEKDQNQNNIDYKYEGGINVGLDFGIHSFRTQNRAFVISAGYRYQHVKEISKSSYYMNSTSTTTYSYEFNRIAVKIGFMFM